MRKKKRRHPEDRAFRGPKDLNVKSYPNPPYSKSFIIFAI
jgi:hypothetical protein